MASNSGNNQSFLSKVSPPPPVLDESNKLCLAPPPTETSWLSTTVRVFKIIQAFAIVDPTRNPPIPQDATRYLFFCVQLVSDVRESNYIKALGIRRRLAKSDPGRFAAESSSSGPSRKDRELMAEDDGDTSDQGIAFEDPFAPLKLLDKLDRLIFTAKRLTLENREGKECVRICKDYVTMKMECKFMLSYIQPSAAKWHTKRRAGMLKHHGEELRKLHSKSDTLLTVFSVFGVSLGQLFIASNIVGRTSWVVDFTLAATVGAFFAFGFQALNHILMHCRLSSVALKKGLALLASSCSPLPWFSYYMSGGHARHHKNAGTEADIDRQAFFWIWEKVPHEALDNPLGSVLWVSLAALLLPVAYMYSLFFCFYYRPKQNIVEMLHFLSESAATSMMFYLTWRWNPTVSSLAYLVLSGAFSMGFLAHPYLGFWILQHLCVLDSSNPSGSQPTVSYYGNKVWNWLNYNILLHVEHHDFSKIPWHLAGTMREIAPEYYDGLKHSDSIIELMEFWIFSKGKKMDFCCEHLFGMD